jgi:hypothetical protein
MRIENSPKNCIRTNSGLCINVFNTTFEMICIEDIAHALAGLPRWGGHLNRHYSVAQHCVLCARMAKSKVDKQAALLHDATEAFILDMPTPIKAKLTQYKRVENKLMNVIFKKYSIPYPYSTKIKKIDTKMLHIEWDNLVDSDNKKFKCWSKKKAKKEFLKMFKKLF